MSNFKLKKTFQEEDNTKYTFYQICKFKFEGLYNVRKIVFLKNCDIIKITEKGLHKIVLDKFLENAPLNKYYLYPNYILKDIELPNMSILNLAMSEMLK